MSQGPFSVQNLGNFWANSIFGHNVRDNLNMAKILVQQICITVLRRLNRHAPISRYYRILKFLNVKYPDISPIPLYPDIL